MLDVSLDKPLKTLVMERAIATLKQDLPNLFQKKISFHIYSPDILFQDPINRLKGKFSYRLIFWVLRLQAKLFFTKIIFDLHRVEPESGETIFAEWTVRGTLWLPWKPKLVFSGYSSYKLNQSGLISEHIDTWDRPPIQVFRQILTKN
jgi:hypothetical protein